MTTWGKKYNGFEKKKKYIILMIFSVQYMYMRVCDWLLRLIKFCEFLTWCSWTLWTLLIFIQFFNVYCIVVYSSVIFIIITPRIQVQTIFNECHYVNTSIITYYVKSRLCAIMVFHGLCMLCIKIVSI